MHINNLESHRMINFVVDKAILNDPAMDHVNNITLSYTFFRTGDDGPVAEAEQGHKAESAGAGAK